MLDSERDSLANEYINDPNQASKTSYVDSSGNPCTHDDASMFGGVLVVPLGGDSENGGDLSLHLDKVTFNQVRAECAAMMVKIDAAYGIDFDPFMVIKDLNKDAFNKAFADYATSLDAGASALTLRYMSDVQHYIAPKGIIEAIENVRYDFAQPLGWAIRDEVQSLTDRFPYLHFVTWSTTGEQGIYAEYVTHVTDISGKLVEKGSFTMKENWWVGDVDPIIRLQLLVGTDRSGRAVVFPIDIHVNENARFLQFTYEAFPDAGGNPRVYTSLNEVLGNLEQFMGEASAQCASIQQISYNRNDATLSFIVGVAGDNVVNPGIWGTVDGLITLTGAYSVTINSFFGKTLGREFTDLADFLDWAGIRLKLVQNVLDTVIMHRNGAEIRLGDTSATATGTTSLLQYIPDVHERAGIAVPESLRFTLDIPLMVVSDKGFRSSSPSCISLYMDYDPIAKTIDLYAKGTTTDAKLGTFNVDTVGSALSNFEVLATRLANLRKPQGGESYGFRPEVSVDNGKLSISLYLDTQIKTTALAPVTTSPESPLDLATFLKSTSSDAAGALLDSLPLIARGMVYQKSGARYQWVYNGVERSLDWGELASIFNFIKMLKECSIPGIRKSITKMICASFIFTREGIDLSVYPGDASRSSLYTNLLHLTFAGAPDGIVTDDAIAYRGSFATWRDLFILKNVSPDPQGAKTSSLFSEISLVGDTFTGVFPNGNTIIMERAVPGDDSQGWRVISAIGSSADAGTVWPSLVAYVDYYIHRQGATDIIGRLAGGQWSYDSTQAQAANSMRIYGSVTRERVTYAGWITLHYNSGTGMFSYGVDYVNGIPRGFSETSYFSPWVAFYSAMDVNEYQKYP
ncbi:MAG TPA: hypothetical protein VKM55_23495 [Candidatus Lokiarchaeia archaeon]|nr:hypothetical protein [Candidatus Lokiarchaeia archaeon]